MCSSDLVSLDKPFWQARVFGWDLAVSGKDLILLVGGLFLIAKSTKEIHEKLEGEDGSVTNHLAPTFVSVIIQILLIDIVFSLDSVITAVGMVDDVRVMIAAVIASLGLMMWFARPIGEFVDTHPSIKMLALSFLVVVGVVLVAEGFGHHVPKGYVYFAMAFSFAVELLNIRFRKTRAKPVKLRDTMPKDEPR